MRSTTRDVARALVRWSPAIASRLSFALYALALLCALGAMTALIERAAP